MELVDLFWTEFEKVDWFRGNPGLSVQALYECIFYRYTKTTSSDARFVGSVQLRMKRSIDEWKKTI
jgi:hypothetical protein